MKCHCYHVAKRVRPRARIRRERIHGSVFELTTWRISIDYANYDNYPVFFIKICGLKGLFGSFDLVRDALTGRGPPVSAAGC